MNRTDYLEDKDVQDFVAFLAGVIQGKSLGLSIGFSRNQLYDGFEDKFPGGYHDYRNGGGPVYVVRAESLESLLICIGGTERILRATCLRSAQSARKSRKPLRARIARVRTSSPKRHVTK